MGTLRSNRFSEISLSGLLVGILILVLAAGVAIVRHQHRYHDVQQWLEVPARIEIKRFDHFRESNSKMSGYVVSREKWTSADYTYAVNGVSYQGHEVSGHGPVIRAELPEHPTTVFYNPAVPSDAVLIREPPEDTFTIVLFGGAFAAFLGISWLWFRELQKRRNRAKWDLYWIRKTGFPEPVPK